MDKQIPETGLTMAEVAEKLCNKVAVIKEGKLIAFDEMKKIIKDKSLEDMFMEYMNE